MRKFTIFLMIFLCLLTCCPCYVAAAGEQSVVSGCSTLQAKNALGSEEAYTGTAKAMILYELDTKTLVYAHNPDASINPTGLVKLMTVLVALEEGDLDEVVTVKQSSLNALSGGAKKLGLKANDQLTVKDLLYCIMVVSANDAAVVLADHIAGSQSAFVAKMNAKAATLGCTNTHFADVNGLNDANQHSTVRELAIITEEALKNNVFTELFGAVNYQLSATVSCDKLTLVTTNSLMNPNSKLYDERCTGGKPSAAGGADRSIVCTAQSDTGRYLCLLISVADKKTDYSGTMKEAKNLISMGLEGYAVQQVLGADQPFGMYAVAQGENSVVVSPDRDVYALLPVKLDQSLLQFRDVKNSSSLTAPLKEGTAVGTLQILYGQIVVGEVNLLACHDVALEGTTITQVPNTKSSPFLKILKWGGIILLCMTIVAAGGLIALRQINMARYKKKKHHRRPGVQEESR